VDLEYRPEIVADIKSLPTEELQKLAARLIFDVAAGKVVGKELDYRVATGDLRDCFKVYFDEPGTGQKPAYRFVYRLLPNRIEALTVEAIAIGLRQDLRAYVTAAQRLGRTTAP
jgi:hypothetical protein